MDNLTFGIIIGILILLYIIMMAWAVLYSFGYGHTKKKRRRYDDAYLEPDYDELQ